MPVRSKVMNRALTPDQTERLRRVLERIVGRQIPQEEVVLDSVIEALERIADLVEER